MQPSAELERLRVMKVSDEESDAIGSGDAERITPRAGGQAQTDHFKGLHILNRLPDGSWKLSRNIWNLNPAG